MVFSSPIFLFIFLPIVLLCNYFLNNRLSNIFLLAASLLFYAWGEPYLVLVMILSIFINWILGLIIDKEKQSVFTKKAALIIGIIFDLSLLGYYKYFGFITNIINSVSHHEIIHTVDIRLPIGISFFTFQAISYLIDIYRGEVSASRKFTNTALYISFFPQLIAGPIVKYKEINKQIDHRFMTLPGIAQGFRLFIYGLAKKVLIANTLALCADTVYMYDIAHINSASAWIASLAYTFQIYYDFSGYSDMAIGLGQMFGFNIPRNFNYPYLSKSISEFWRRWHISLGSWFREYVYFPLGGSRKGTFRNYINLFIVFLLTGIWHGAGFSFITWGLYHAFFSIIERLGLNKLLKKSNIISCLYCFMVVNFGWVIFRVNDLRKTFQLFIKMLTPWNNRNAFFSIRGVLDNKTIFIAFCAILGSGLLTLIVPQKLKDKWKNSSFEAVYCLILLFLSVIYITGDTYNPFIYFQF